MEFQNSTLACNGRWRLTDDQLALLWQAEFPNSRTRYTMKSVRTVRNLFNLGRRNNDRPRTPTPQYDPLGIRCWTCRTSDSMDGDALAGTIDDSMIVQLGLTQSTRRLRMEMHTTTPSSPLPPRRTGFRSRRRESAPNVAGNLQPFYFQQFIEYQQRPCTVPCTIFEWIEPNEPSRPRTDSSDRVT